MKIINKMSVLDFMCLMFLLCWYFVPEKHFLPPYLPPFCRRCCRIFRLLICVYGAYIDLPNYFEVIMMPPESLEAADKKELDAGDFRVRIRSGPLGVLTLLILLSIQCWTSLLASMVASFMLFWIFGGLIPSFLFFATSPILLYRSQDSLLYHPYEPKNARINVKMPPGKVPHESLVVKSPDGTRLHMLLIRQAEPLGSSCPTILIFHGNAGNVGHLLHNAGELYSTLVVNVLLLEYRGYGLSKGQPSEEGLYMDGATALNYLHTRSDINHEQIVVFGRSLGGAVAIELASKAENAGKIWCLILENTFTSVPDMARELLGPWMAFIPLCLYKNKFTAQRKIGKVTVPTLFLSGQSDSLVPPDMMDALMRDCGSPLKTIVRLPGGRHNDTWQCYNYYQNIFDFLEKVRQTWKTESLQRGGDVAVPIVESSLLAKVHHV